MTGVALGSIWLSYLMGALFGPDMVTGAQHEHFPSAAVIGWIFTAIATGMVMPAALAGMRAKVTDRGPWAMLGFSVGAVWLANMFVAVFAPVWVTGTDPDELPVWALFSAIAALIVTGVLCNLVKTGSFETASFTAPPAAPPPAQGTGSAAEDATVTLRRLAQLRDAGAITDVEFQAKKEELLTRI